MRQEIEKDRGAKRGERKTVSDWKSPKEGRKEFSFERNWNSEGEQRTHEESNIFWIPRFSFSHSMILLQSYMEGYFGRFSFFDPRILPSFYIVKRGKKVSLIGLRQIDRWTQYKSTLSLLHFTWLSLSPLLLLQESHLQPISSITFSHSSLKMMMMFTTSSSAAWKWEDDGNGMIHSFLPMYTNIPYLRAQNIRCIFPLFRSPRFLHGNILFSLSGVKGETITALIE